MRFRITLYGETRGILPINYQYPLSSSLYRIISKGDADYASFLHQTGYGKGFKLFTFSQINCPFDRIGDRLHLKSHELWFDVAFHLPEAMESFIKGLFQSENIDIADKSSRASFTVKSVESLPNPLQKYKENEILNLRLKPISSIIAGLQNKKGYYDFLSPEYTRFTESLIYNWRSKIATCYDATTGSGALLMMEIIQQKQPPKSRLIWVKAGTPQQTKIKSWYNFDLKVTGEKRFVELLLNAGTGIYNSMGCGCVECFAL